MAKVKLRKWKESSRILRALYFQGNSGDLKERFMSLKMNCDVEIDLILYFYSVLFRTISPQFEIVIRACIASSSVIG